MDIPKTIIVMGRSGSGKGTQIELLKELYKSKSPHQNILHFEPGNIFRSMVESGSYPGKKVHNATAAGKLVPDFITNGLFVSDLAHNLEGENQLLIFDGYPRSINQAEALDQALKYYDRNSAVIIHVEVSEQEVRNRLASRGRADDIEDKALNTRIMFYNDSVLPTIEWYRNHPNYTVLDINGEGDINSIQGSIITALSN